MRYWKRRYGSADGSAAVTINMLLEYLETTGFCIVKKPVANARFNHVVPIRQPIDSLSDDSQWAFDSAASDSLGLRICDAQEMHRVGQEGPSCTLVLIDAQGENENIPLLASSRAVRTAIVKAPAAYEGIASLHNLVLEFLLSIRELTERLAHASSESGSFQKLIDVGEDFFGCFMNITDTNYVLLAHTRHIEPRDEINASLVKLGYHIEAHLNRRRSTGYLLENIAKQTGVQIHPPESPFPYALITSVMHVDGQYAGHVLMACEEEDITPGTVDAFTLFSSFCERLARRKPSVLPLQNSPSQTLLLRLIAEKDIDSIFLREQAEQLGISASGIFTLALFDYQSTLQSQLSYFATAIDQQIDTPHIAFLLGDSIALLLYGDTEPALWNALIHAKDEHPGSIHPQAYVSDAFYKLSGIYYAYRQIAAIRKYERDIRLCLALTEGEERGDMLSFRDAFCFYWEDTLADEEIRHFSLSHVLVSSIAQNDRERGTDDLALLFTFLANERKATLVGSKCHLHRNGVLYRIEKMAHEYGLDLNDYLTRQYLQVSIRIKLAASQEFSQLMENTLGLYAENLKPSSR